MIRSDNLMSLHRDLDKASYHFVYIGRTPPKLGICDVSVSKNICTPYHRQFLHPLHILESKFKSNYLQCLIWQSLHIKCNKASNIDGILVHYWCSCLHYIWLRDRWWRYTCTTEPFNSASRIALQIITCINIIIICH